MTKKFCSYLFFVAAAYIVSGIAGPYPAAVAAASGVENPAGAPGDLSALIAEGLSQNQQIASTEALARALKEEAVAKGSWPDPKIGFGVMNLPTNSLRFDREPMTQKQITFSQKIPWAPKNRLASEITVYKALEMKRKAGEMRVELAYNIARAYYELGYQAARLKTNRALYRLVQRIKRDATDAYAVGQVPQQDIFQAEVELLRLETEKITIETEIRRAQDRICGLLNRKGRCNISPPIAMPDPERLIPKNDLIETALKNNPRISTRKATLKQAEKSILFAKNSYYPDFNVVAAYGQRDSDVRGKNLADFVSLSVQLTLPLWHESSQDRLLSAAKSRADAAQAAIRQIKRELPHRIDSILARLTEAAKRYRIIKQEILPAARQRARAAADGYQVGRVPFDTMIQAQAAVLRLELEADKACFDAYKQKAALDAAAGIIPVDAKSPVTDNKANSMGER